MDKKTLDGNKINIRLTPRSYAVLENDSLMFDCKQKSKFINNIVMGMYDSCMEKLENEARSIVDELGDPLISTKGKMIEIIKNKYKGTNNIHLKPYLQEETVSILNDNGFYNEHGFASKMVSFLLNEYASMVYFERERVFYWSYVNDLSLGKMVRLRSDGETVNFKPYKIMTDEYSTCNYIVGYKRHQEEYIPACYKLVLIDKIISTNKSFELSNAQSEYLDKIISERGVQYIFGEDIEIKVKLTKDGEVLLRRIVNQRPICFDSKDGYFYFKCSEHQAYVYFKKFGKDGIVVEPQSLADRIKASYKEGLLGYEEKRD